MSTSAVTIVSCTEQGDASAMFTVVGTDTYLGAHMEKHLRSKFQLVYGYSQNEEIAVDIREIPVNEINKLPKNIPSVKSDWFVVCIDPGIGFEKYIEKLKRLFDDLAAQGFIGDICFLSSAALCMPDIGQKITEDTIVYSRNEHDLAFAVGEQLLTVLGCSGKGYAVPHIMRIGVPYGDEIGMEKLPGLVNRLVADAQNQSAVQIPLGREAKRSLTHISDICESVIGLMCSEYCPPLVNIPGETKSIGDIGRAISENCQAVFKESGLSRYDDLDFYTGDQELSDDIFKEHLKYNRRYSFEKWLGERRYLRQL